MIKPTPQSYFSPVPKLAGDLAGTRFEGHPEVFCQMVPKAETHLHGGAMAPLPVAWDIASRRMARTGEALQLHGRTFKSLEDVRELYANPRQRSLPAYLDAYAMLSKHLFTNEADIEDVAYQGAMEAARHGVSLLEIRTSIKSGALGDTKYKIEGLTPEQEFMALARGFERAKRDSANHVETFLTVCLRRDDTDIERAKAIVSQAAELKALLLKEYGTDYVRGIDLAGHEKGYKLKIFKPVYDHARALGFTGFTAHSGEYFHEGGVNQAVFNLEVQRVGHATALFLPLTMIPGKWRAYKGENEKQTFISLIAKGVVIETCLTSNMHCGAEVTMGYRSGTGMDSGGGVGPKWRNAVPLGRNGDGDSVYPITFPLEDPSRYPLEINIALGGMNLLATDGIFTLDTNLTQEYMLAAAAFDLGARELLCLSYHSILHSFAPDDVKRRIIETQWRPFATEFFPESDPEQAMFTHLEHWRKTLRRKHHIPNQVIEVIEEKRNELSLKKT